MRDPKTDEKNIQLLRLLAQLRDHIDIHRIIGLNVGALREGQISGALLGYLQKSAHESLAIYICKIFESSTRNDLNSIPGIIESIPATPVSDVQGRQLRSGRNMDMTPPLRTRGRTSKTHLTAFAPPTQSHSADSRNSGTQSAPIAITTPTSRLFRRMPSSRPFSASPRSSTRWFRTPSPRADPR